MTREIVAARRVISQSAGIPMSDIVGVRAPYLDVNPEQRRVLWQNGFLYDSSLIEEGTGSSLSTGPAGRVWPFTLQDGIPIICAW